MKTAKLALLLFGFILFLSACGNQTVATETAIPSATKAQTERPTSTVTATPNIAPKAAFTLTPTLTSTAIPIVNNREIFPAYVGTALPAALEPINAGNFSQIEQVAQWGKGSMLGIAFSPDGNLIVAGSAHGYAIYDTRAPNETPQWIPFSSPFEYKSLFFSADGHYLLLEADEVQYFINFPNGQIIEEPSGVTWLRTSTLSQNWGELVANSPDGKLQLKSRSTHDEETWDLEYSVREIFDTETQQLLYQLPDETIQVNYDDRTEPEGCDLNSFSPCGNAYAPSAAHPYRAAFSPTGKSLSILYRAPNLWNSRLFSTLRVYDASNGKLTGMIGSFSRPVETFAYAPQGDKVVVGFIDGSIEVWEVTRNEIQFSAWHFMPPIIDIKFSFDGKYTVIQRPETLEIRLTDNGAMRSRFDVTSFAISPVQNIIALGHKDGSLILKNIDTGKTIFNIEAHKGKIFSLAFSPNGDVLASSGNDCNILSWDARTGEFLHYFEENSTDAYDIDIESRIFIYHMKYIPGTNSILGFGSWSRVVSWNVNSGATQFLIEPQPLEYYQGMVTIKPHFPEFLGLDLQRNTFSIDATNYDLETGNPLDQFQIPETLTEGCYAAGPVSTDGKLKFSLGYDVFEGKICILDANDLHLLSLIDVVPANHDDYYNPLKWLYLSPDGQHLFVNVLGDVVNVYQVSP